MRSRLERIDRRIERTSKKLNRWRQTAETRPPQRAGVEPQLTTLAPALWRPSTSSIPEAPTVEAGRTSRRPSLFDLPESWTPSGEAQPSTPQSPSIALDLVNEPLRESLLGASALSEACRHLLARLGSLNEEYGVQSDLRLLDRLADERRQVEQTLVRVRAIQRGRLLARFPVAAPATPPPSAAPSTSRAQPMPCSTAPKAIAGYPPRLVRLVGGPEAMNSLPELDVQAILGPQGRVAQLEPKHLSAPLMRGAWPPHQLFLAFKLWQQPKPNEPAAPGLVMLVQDEVQPLSWHTLNPMRFRTEGREHNETPSFLELRSDRVIGNQQGERFLQGLERIVCSAEGRLGVYTREEPTVERQSKVAFAPPPEPACEQPKHDPIPQQVPYKSAIKQRPVVPEAPPAGQTLPAPQDVRVQGKELSQPGQTSAAKSGRGERRDLPTAASSTKTLAKGKAVARPVPTTRRLGSALRVPTQSHAGEAPMRGRTLVRSAAVKETSQPKPKPQAKR